MTEFEHCGWGDDGLPLIYEGNIAASRKHVCEECKKEIRPGYVCHVYLFDEEADDCQTKIINAENGTLEINDGWKEECWVPRKADLIIFLCEPCADLYQSLIEAGKEPRIGEIYACRDEMIRHRKADRIWSKLAPLTEELTRILEGTNLAQAAHDLDDQLWELVEDIRRGEKT